jgi:hypothetical protein
MIRRLTIALLVPILLSSCHTESRSLKAIARRFYELESAGRIPGLGPDEQGEVSIYSVTSSMRTAEWFRPFSERMKKYSELYAVDVTSNGKHVMVFLCGDQRQLCLATVFAERNGNWHEEKLPKPD